MTEKNWYYEQNGLKNGPILKDELAKLIIDKSLDQHTLIWCDGMSTWLKVSQTEDFKKIEGPPPLPITHVSSGYILSVAILPIWILFVQLIISFGLAGDDYELGAKYYEHGSWIVVTAIFNAIFCSIDSNKLKKIGVEVSYIWGLFLVPVYIYQRGSNLMKIYGGDFVKNQIFFFVWIGSFLLSMFISVPLGMMMAIIK